MKNLPMLGVESVTREGPDAVVVVMNGKGHRLTVEKARALADELLEYAGALLEAAYLECKPTSPPVDE